MHNNAQTREKYYTEEGCAIVMILWLLLMLS